MGPVSTERDPGRAAWALLLVALVAAMGLAVAAPAAGIATSAQAGAGAVHTGTPHDAIAPTRATSGLSAEPSLARAPVDTTLGALPSGLTLADLIRLSGSGATGSAEPRGALRGVAGVRGPPFLAGLEI